MIPKRYLRRLHSHPKLNAAIIWIGIFIFSALLGLVLVPQIFVNLQPHYFGKQIANFFISHGFPSLASKIRVASVSILDWIVAIIFGAAIGYFAAQRWLSCSIAAVLGCTVLPVLDFLTLVEWSHMPTALNPGYLVIKCLDIGLLLVAALGGKWLRNRKTPSPTGFPIITESQ